MVQLEKDDGAVTKRRKSVLDLPSKQEMMIAHNHLLFTKASNMNTTELDGVRSPSRFTFRRHSLTHGVQNARRQFGSEGVPFTTCEDKQVGSPGGSVRVENSCKEIICEAEEESLVSRRKEEKDHGLYEAKDRRKKPRREDDDGMKKAENPRTSEGMQE